MQTTTKSLNLSSLLNILCLSIIFSGIRVFVYAQAPGVTSISPSQGALNIDPASQIVVTFDNAIDPQTVDAGSFIVSGEVSGPHNGSLSVVNSNMEIDFSPTVQFLNGEVVHVDVSSNITDGSQSIQPFVSQFTVKTNPSDGAFAPGVTYEVQSGSIPLGVFVYDLDGDGDADIVAANSNYGGATGTTVSVFLNNGDATFEAAVNYDAGFSPGCESPLPIYVHDLDGDGDGDIAVATDCPSLTILMNNGDGTFGSPAIYSVQGRPDKLKVSDLDGDGDADVIISGGGLAGAGLPYFSVLLNAGDGTFGTPVQYFSGSHQQGIAIYDVDQDGDQDAVTCNRLGGMTVSFNNGSGVFNSPTDYSAGLLPCDVYVSDIDGDGDGDVAIANQTQGPAGCSQSCVWVITVYKNNGDGTFVNRTDYPVNGAPTENFISDVDGDGDGDIITANHFGGTGNTVSILYNNGSGVFINRRDFPVNAAPAACYAADLDNDGDADIVTADWTSGKISVLLNKKIGIMGFVFADQDEDCSVSSGDFGVFNHLVRITKTSTNEIYYAVSDLNGEYAAVVPGGNYTISLVHNDLTQETCNSGQGITYQVTVPDGGVSTGNNFFIMLTCQAAIAINPIISGTCSSCTIGGGRTLCPCETFQYAVSVTATNHIPNGATFQIVLDPNVGLCNPLAPGSIPGTPIDLTSLTGSSPNCASTCPSQCVGAIYGATMNFTFNTSFNSAFVFNLDVQVCNVPVISPCAMSTSITANPCCATGNCGPTAFTATYTSSTRHICCSMDPNDKKVDPNEEGLCSGIPSGQRLVYHIRFQNLGSAPAEDIVILDEISSNLDIESFQVLSTSHPNYTVNILPGNILQWSFPDIYLPDFTSDIEGSDGYIEFSINAKDHLENGTVISNSADVYFDNNAPITTNTTTNTINNLTFASPEIPENGELISCDQSITLDAGSGYASYLWSDASTNQKLTVTQSGTYSVTVTDNSGCTTVGRVTVTLLPLPTITGPSNITACEGSDATFSIQTSGASLTYQWWENTGSGWTALSDGPKYSGTTTPSLNVIGVTVGMSSYRYRCVVTEICGQSVTSSAARLTVTPIVTFNTQPHDRSICEGATETVFTAVPNCPTFICAFSYQWQILNSHLGWLNVTNGTEYSGATTYELGINNAPLSLTGMEYRCLVSYQGYCDGASNSAILTVNPLLPVSVSIGASPPGAICAGTNVTFTATPTNGGSSPSYQWKLNGNNAGTNSSTYANSSLANSDVVTCVLTSNATPCATGNPATSNSITMIVNPLLPVSVSIGASPSGAICAGTNVTFTATPTNGGTTPSYQWKLNGNNTGTNSTTYSNSSLANSDVVTCVLTSNATPCATGNPATSNSITMTVNPILAVSVSIGASPSGAICAGTNVTFTATPTNGGSTPSYQWKLNNNNAGTNSSTYASSLLSNTDVVSCVLTSNATCPSGNPATSNSITMAVNPLLPVSVSIAASPAGAICAGTNVTFTATPTNEGTTPSYQWKLNGNDVGTNSTTYVNSLLVNSDIVTCILTSNATPCATGNPATSNSITMTVNPVLPVSVSIGASPSGAICTGTSVTFTATPTNGGSSPSYQWKLNGNNVGTNSTTYTNSSLVNSDIVTCVLTSNATPCATGSPATSNSITMSVNSLSPVSVSIGASPSGAVCAGTNVTFTATPTNGGSSPSYQWKLNSSTVGTNSSAYSNSSLSNSDVVSCVLTSNATCPTGNPATSNSITMAVNPLPVANTGSNQNVCSGETISIGAASVSGNTYSWSPTTYLSSGSVSNPTFTSSTAGTTTYTLTETITATGCQKSNGVSVTVISGGGNPSFTCNSSSLVVASPYTDCVSPGSGNYVMMQVKINLGGGCSGAQRKLQTLKFTASTATCSNIENAKLWYSGNSNSFSNANIVSAASTITSVSCTSNNTWSTGTLQVMQPGDNYFWVTYKVRSTAHTGETVAASLVSVTVVANGNTTCSTFGGSTSSRTIQSSGCPSARSGEDYPDQSSASGHLGLAIYPNPASQATTIEFKTDHQGELSMRVIDRMGLLVNEFFSRKYFEAGIYSFEFATGKLPPGIYICELTDQYGRVFRKLVVQH